MIRKFLDAQRIHNPGHLQTLHRQSLANADHTTLLLNCYLKLKRQLEAGGVHQRCRVVQLKGFFEGFTRTAGRGKSCLYLGDQDLLVLWSVGKEEKWPFLWFSPTVSPLFCAVWLVGSLLVPRPGIEPGTPAVKET